MDLLNTASYYYDLPKRLIAQTPAEKRDMSRLLIIDKNTGETKHKIFSDITEELRPGDCLVINDTRVIPARLYGKRFDKLNTAADNEIETVLLTQEGECWKCLTRPGKKTRPGTKIYYSDELCGTVEDVIEDGLRLIRFEYTGNFYEILDRTGIMPLPPYITEKLRDRNRYQTVYAAHNGSAAA
ncbi:MAG: S-adenosylmethionine:tRNA ribosyltransferase-isomerase, partial [Clostridia bacterium]|nr:S-adenosylmethionine:tRNA ribosyltransferase-isomerase [Clostridia bacterium]